MLRKRLILITAASTLTLTGAAFAKPPCDGGGVWAGLCNNHAGTKSSKKKDAVEQTPAATEGDANASATGTTNVDTSGAALGAAAGASGAATAAAGAGSLAGLATGQTVKTSGGEALGKVSKIVKGADGSVSQVIVTSPSGRSFPLSAGKLSIANGVVIATDESQ